MYYAERLAQRLFEINPGLDSTGRAGEVLDAAWPMVVKDCGVKSAQWSFWYDEDFPSDVVTAYAELQQSVNTNLVPVDK
jgi:hypothetical protein